MPGSWLGLTGDSDQRSCQCEVRDDIERHTPAVDHRQAGGDTLGLDRLAAIAREHRAIAIVEREAAAADGEMSALCRPGGRDVGAIVMSAQ